MHKGSQYVVVAVVDTAAQHIRYAAANQRTSGGGAAPSRVLQHLAAGLKLKQIDF